jgi:hypothetical protein
METVPTAENEILLGLPPLHLKFEAEPQAESYNSVARDNEAQIYMIQACE